MATTVPTFTLRGVEYVILERARFERLAGPGAALDVDDVAAEKHARIGARLRAAREHAKLTQAEVARKIGKSPTAVSLAEGGRMRVGDRFVGLVLRACGLREDWQPTKARSTRARGKA